MSLCFLLKLLGQFSFYFFAANTAAAFFGYGLTSLWPLFLLSGVGAFCFVLHCRQPRFAPLPLALAPLCFFAAHSWADVLLLLLPCGYLVVMCHQKSFDCDHSNEMDTFSFLLKVLVPCGLIALGMYSFGTTLPLLLPCLLLFLFCHILLLRMLRHSPETLEQSRFKWINLAEIGVLVALVFLLNTPAVLHAAASGVKGAFQLIVAPVMMLFVYAASAIVWLLDQRFGGFGSAAQETEPVPLLDIADSPMMEQLQQGTANPALIQILQGLAVLVLLVAAFFVFRRMLAKRRRAAAWDGIRQSTSTIAKWNGNPKTPADRFPPREPRAAVRYYYRRFLSLCLDLGFPIAPKSDSAQVAEMAKSAFPVSALQQLRQVYVRARYSGHTVTQEDALIAKDLYRQMKANSKGKQ